MVSKTMELKTRYGVCQERIVTSILEAVSRGERLSFQRTREKECVCGATLAASELPEDYT